MTPLAHAETPNDLVWDRARRGHYEVWFLMAHARAEQASVWIRYTIEAPTSDAPPSARLWFALADSAKPARNVALNRAFPLAALVTSSRPFSVSIDGARLTGDSAQGTLSGGGHTIAWDLTWRPSDRPLRYLPDLAYRVPLGTVVVGVNPSVPVRGVVEVDGRRLVFEGDPLVQEHLWGRKHAHAWAWGQCNGFTGDRAVVLESLSARVRRGGVTSPPITCAVLRIGDEEIAFNDLTTLPFNRATVRTGRFELRARSPRARLEASFSCRPEDLVVAAYRDPDGEPRFCHNTGVADCRLRLFRRRSLLGYEPAGEWHADRTARLETGGPEPDPQVTHRHEVAE